MVFVRVHVLKNYLSAEQKKELGDKLIAAIADAEKLTNSLRHQQTSWVQFFELDRENWYLPVTIGDPDAFWQVDVIAPQAYLPTGTEARIAIENVTAAIRSFTGDGVLPSRGPWVQVYAIPDCRFGVDGSIPDFEAARAYFASETVEEAADAWATTMGRTVDLSEVKT